MNDQSYGQDKAIFHVSRRYQICNTCISKHDLLVCKTLRVRLQMYALTYFEGYDATGRLLFDSIAPRRFDLSRFGSDVAA
jgi:hypothetical protein